MINTDVLVIGGSATGLVAGMTPEFNTYQPILNLSKLANSIGFGIFLLIFNIFSCCVTFCNMV